MFKFDELAINLKDPNTGKDIIDPNTGKPKKEEYYNPEIHYYKKVEGMWTWAEELSYSKDYVKAYVSTGDATKLPDKQYYYYDDTKEKIVEFKGKEFEKEVVYYEIKTIPRKNDNGEQISEDFIYSKYGPRGNISYYTWDNNIVWYRENCEYHRANSGEKY
jgi:hypothetical protein